MSETSELHFKCPSVLREDRRPQQWSGGDSEDPQMGEKSPSSLSPVLTRLSVPLRGPHPPSTADGKCAPLPASCDPWTAGRRSPWPRRSSRPHRGLSARLGRPPPWRRWERSGLRADADSGARSGRRGRSSRAPAHAVEHRGEGHLTPRPP